MVHQKIQVVSQKYKHNHERNTFRTKSITNYDLVLQYDDEYHAKKCIFYGRVSTILIGSMSLMINNEKLAFMLGTSLNHLNS